MDNLTDITLPIERQFENGITEKTLSKAFRDVLISEIGQGIKDILDYGAPFLGSNNVVERFAKNDGLAVLRRNTPESDKIMQIIYANWLALGSERGTAFLEFVLKMFWGGSYTIKRLYHPVQYANEYPRMLFDHQMNDSFLTSRIRINMDSTVSIEEASELAPTLTRLVPANIVAQITMDSGLTAPDMRIGLACVSSNYMVFDAF